MTKPHIPLDEIRAQVEGCRKCPLADGRTQTVFGVGNPEARVMIIGEAPGKNEDLQGEPFVGAAGKYLNELLAVAGLVREDVFIANVLKCRPPGNRDPRPEEIELCTPYLREQTRTIDPEFLVTLGNFSTKFILKTDIGITRLHGTVQRAGKFKVFPIFHPAAALYDGSKREALENDFATLGELLRASEAERAAEAAAKAAEPAEATAAEQIAKDVAQVHTACAAKAATKAAAGLAGPIVGIDPSETELVIALALVRVGKNIVGLVDLLELFLGILIAGVQIRVVLFGQLAVGAFDLGIGGVFADPQHLVVISFFCHRIYPLYLWVVKRLPAEGKLSAQRTDEVGAAGDCP